MYKVKIMKQTYIEIKVPLRSDAKWLAELKRAFCSSGIKVAWKIPGHPHLTLVFIDETPDVKDLVKAVTPYIYNASTPTITFDRLNVFLAQSGTKYIVNLTASTVPEEFQSLVDNIREALKRNGAVIKSAFRLHLTLGEVATCNAEMPQIEDVLNGIILPAFSLTLRNVVFREFRGERTMFAEWKLSSDTYTDLGIVGKRRYLCTRF